MVYDFFHAAIADLANRFSASTIFNRNFLPLAFLKPPQTSDPSRRFIYYIIGPNIKKLFKDRYTARYHGLGGLIPFGERSVLFDAGCCILRQEQLPRFWLIFCLASEDGLKIGPVRPRCELLHRKT